MRQANAQANMRRPVILKLLAQKIKRKRLLSSIEPQNMLCTTAQESDLVIPVHAWLVDTLAFSLALLFRNGICGIYFKL